MSIVQSLRKALNIIIRMLIIPKSELFFMDSLAVRRKANRLIVANRSIVLIHQSKEKKNTVLENTIKLSRERPNLFNSKHFKSQKSSFL